MMENERDHILACAWKAVTGKYQEKAAPQKFLI